jgi:hypothetical protein
MQRVQQWICLVVAAVAVGIARPALGLGFCLAQTKEELKLKYDVAATEHPASGRATFVLTLVDEGRLKPLEAVQLVVQTRGPERDGTRPMDLVVSMKLRKTDGEQRVGQVHLLRELAERAEIHLITQTMDGKRTGSRTTLIHVIPLAKYLSRAPEQKAP